MGPDVEKYGDFEAEHSGSVSDSNALVMLQQVPKESISIQPFRSGGFINKDYDMARVQIDLPILEAKRLMAALKAI